MLKTLKIFCKKPILILLLIFYCGISVGYFIHEKNLITRLIRKFETIKYYSMGSRSVEVEVRGLRPNLNPSGVDLFGDLEYYYVRQKIDLNRTALVLIDTWGSHDIKNYESRSNNNIKEKLSPLINVARKNGILIVYAPSGEKVSSLILPNEQDLVFNSRFNYDIYSNQYDRIQEEFAAYLRKHGISTLIYAGYATNVCLLFKATGIFPMARKGFRLYFVSDATVAMEGPETIAGHWNTLSTINTIELQFAKSITQDSLINALNKIK